jgi:hypothetical protein
LRDTAQWDVTTHGRLKTEDENFREGAGTMTKPIPDKAEVALELPDTPVAEGIKPRCR